MGTSGLVPKIKDGDWVSVRQAIAKLSTKLGPASEPTYVGLTLTGLTAERLVATNADKKLVSSDLINWITETANQVLVADDGDGTITLSLPQDIHSAATPTFAGLVVTKSVDAELAVDIDNVSPGVSAFSTLAVKSDDGRAYISTFGSNYTTLPFYTNKAVFYGANGGDGIVIGTPNNSGIINFLVGGHASGDEVIRMDSTGLKTKNSKIIDASAGEILVEDNDVDAPTGKSDGYVGVAIIGGIARMYFTVNGTMYYVDGTAAAVPVTGNPIGLLLALTYNIP
jgi:hypothetical protein